MVYEKLLIVMREKKITVSALLRDSNLKRTSFYDKVNGRTKFTLDEAIEIKKFLHVRMPLEKLFERSEDDPQHHKERSTC